MGPQGFLPSQPLLPVMTVAEGLSGSCWRNAPFYAPVVGVGCRAGGITPSPPVSQSLLPAVGGNCCRNRYK